jgi:CHASE3 domain sensor protein/GAF domain-containing protein
VASAVLALLIGLAFTFLLLAIDGMRESSTAAAENRTEIVAAEELERLVIDLETGQRGFVITGQQDFLQPWQTARDAIPAQVRELQSTATTPEQRGRAMEITRDIDSFIRDYSVPLVDAAQRGDPAASSLATTQEGKQRVDVLRADFNTYVTQARTLLQSRQDAADANADRAVLAASMGLGGSTLLIVGYTAYQSRKIVRPVRRAVGAAEHLASGDLTVRMVTTGPAEIGELGASYNTMAASLRESRDRAVAANERLRLLYDASTSVGTALDVERTARELAGIPVPRFADFVTVDLLAPVLRGEEPPATRAAAEVRRVAVCGTREDHPLYPVGTRIAPAPATPQARSLGTRRGRIEADLRTSTTWRPRDPDYARRILDYGIHSLITAPLIARSGTVGLVSFWRSRQEPFAEEDVSFAEELAAKGAAAIDNARRYARERSTALTLQRSLLPQRLPDQVAVEAAFRYLPAGQIAGVGGDWFDVIPLSGTRVALVVGDVVGHGLHASAAMGRLRTAVRTLADVDLPPDELLTHLDDLVIRFAGEEDADDDPGASVASNLGATCLYAVYDPVSRRCSLATAGHPLPVLRGPDGAVERVAGQSGPPLGIGGLPFEATELELAPGSVLALYTDGLIHSRDRDIDSGIAQLCRALARPAATLEAACDTVVDSLLTDRPVDDVALLLARTRALSPEQVATWDIPPDPAHVERARKLLVDQLDAWGLAEAVFTMELVASELVTNAIRHGAPPIRLRVIRDRALLCEVSDGSSTAPHLRRARELDEGGRGLLLVSHLTRSWGTRQTVTGKTIWCEQPLPEH